MGSIKYTGISFLQKKEIPISTHIPYSHHVSPCIIKTKNNDYLTVIKLQGVNFDTVDNEDLNTLHEQRNTLLKSIQHPQLAIWSTLIRAKEHNYPSTAYENHFATELQHDYERDLQATPMFVNQLYLTLIVRDVSVLKVGTIAKKASNKFSNILDKKDDLIELLEKKTAQVVATLGGYEPEVLTTYPFNGAVYSQPLEFFEYLLSGQRKKIPLLRNDIAKTLGRSRILIGMEAGEMRGADKSGLFGVLGIKEYPPSTRHSMLNDLLKLDMEFVLTQSFTFVHRQKAIEAVKFQIKRLQAAEDLSESQIDELYDALDLFASGHMAAGDHHFNLLVKAENIQKLHDNLADAEGLLSQNLIIPAREDLALEAGFWAQLPANFSYRPRASFLHSLNFSALSPFYNTSSGYIDGNHWGQAVTTFRTSTNTPYFFDFHRRDGTGYPPGNGLVVGPTGTGKTVVMTFLLSLAEKYQGRRVFFDKDQGAALIIKASGGNYTVIQQGVPTGFNPFQLEPTEKNIAFINSLLLVIINQSGAPLTSRKEMELFKAVQGVFELDKPDRKLINLAGFLDTTEENGAYHRLQAWMGTGAKAWVFDNEQDSLNLSSDTIGFDMTDVLESQDILAPIFMYINYRLNSLIDGIPFILTIDEMWAYARNPVIGNILLEDHARTIRKKNGIIIFGTNDAEDMANSKLGRTLLSQTQWQMYFPNPKADYDVYCQGLKLSQKELQLIKTLSDKSRQFLIKKGNASTLVKLDLSNLINHLKILSGSTESVAKLNQIIEKVGDNPKDWLPIFHSTKD